jgi:single-strand DNA-binding protein
MFVCVSFFHLLVLVEVKMNTVVLMGNLGRDIDAKVVTTGGRKTTVATCVLAVNRRYKKADGEWGENTTWTPIELWDAGAEAFAEKCAKGDRILIEGSLKSESWEKDGKNHSRLLVRVDKFYLIKKRGEGQSHDNDQDEAF